MRENTRGREREREREWEREKARDTERGTHTHASFAHTANTQLCSIVHVTTFCFYLCTLAKTDVLSNHLDISVLKFNLDCVCVARRCTVLARWVGADCTYKQVLPVGALFRPAESVQITHINRKQHRFEFLLCWPALVLRAAFWNRGWRRRCLELDSGR